MKSLNPDKRRKFFGFLLAFFAAWLLFPFFFDAAVFPIPSTGPSWLTLDPSWKITLSKANVDDLTWGEDFVMTYGPLSYLSTRVGWGISKYSLLLFDIFVSLNFFLIFYRSYVKSQNNALTTTLIIASTLLLPLFLGAGTSLVLFAFLLFWLVESLENNRLYVYFMQVALLLLLFFMKFNTGLISVVIFLACIAYKLVVKQGSRFWLSCRLILPFLLVFPLAKVLNVALVPYITGGVEMVSGYNEIMYLNEPYNDEYFFALLILFLCFVFLFMLIKNEKADRSKFVLITAFFAVSAYVIYKQAFTRMDIQHICEFYSYFLLFLLCFQVFHKVRLSETANVLILIIMFFTVFFAKKRDEKFINLKPRFSKADYFNGFKYFTDTSGLHIFPNNNQLPQPIRTKIGKSTVDVYPWNSQLLIENRLNYTPRPVFQSYTTYTPYLQGLNFNFYTSDKAPQFVVYDFDAIDGRYPLFDDPKLNLVLLQNYNCVDTFSFSGRKQLLLQKSKNSIPVKLEKQKEYALKITDSIIPQPGIFYQESIANNFKGIIAGIFLHAPEINIVITTQDGNKHSFRTSKKLLEAGIFSDYFFSSTTDFYNYLMKQDIDKPENKVQHIALKPVSPGYLHEEITVKEFSIRKNH